jgi:hypothetical protein
MAKKKYTPEKFGNFSIFVGNISSLLDPNPNADSAFQLNPDTGRIQGFD